MPAVDYATLRYVDEGYFDEGEITGDYVLVPAPDWVPPDEPVVVVDRWTPDEPSINIRS